MAYDGQDSIDKLLMFISQTSENYGKLLMLIQSIEQSMKNSPSSRDITDLKEKIEELKEAMSYIKDVSFGSEGFSKIKEMILKLNSSIEESTKILNKLDFVKFNEHTNEVRQIRDVICNEETSKNLKETFETISSIKKFFSSFTEKKKIIIGVIVVIWVIIQSWEKLIKFLEFIFKNTTP